MSTQEKEKRPIQTKPSSNKSIENEKGNPDPVHQSIPVIEERLKIDKREVVTGKVRVTKQVREREVIVNLPGYQEKVEIKRVPVNQVVDRPVAIRQEGETTIIPIMEEVYVLEKRLILKEEVHIHKRRIDKAKSKKVVLKREEPVIEHVNIRSENPIEQSKNKSDDPHSTE